MLSNDTFCGTLRYAGWSTGIDGLPVTLGGARSGGDSTVDWEAGGIVVPAAGRMDSWLSSRDWTAARLGEATACPSLLTAVVVERAGEGAELLPLRSGGIWNLAPSFGLPFLLRFLVDGVERASISCPFDPARTSSCCLFSASLSTVTPGWVLSSFGVPSDFWPGSLNVSLCDDEDDDGSGVFVVAILSLRRGVLPSVPSCIPSGTTLLASATRFLK